MRKIAAAVIVKAKPRGACQRMGLVLQLTRSFCPIIKSDQNLADVPLFFSSNQRLSG
jgi:hypothetical protein